MKRMIFLWGIFLLVAPSGSQAQVVIGSVRGDIELFTGEVECPSLPSGCILCVNDVDTTGDNRLIVAAGTVTATVQTVGLVEGVVRPFVLLDGLEIAPDLLPAGSYFRAGVRWSDLPFPASCDGSPPGVTFEIADLGEMTRSGDGSMFVDINASHASEIP